MYMCCILSDVVFFFYCYLHGCHGVHVRDTSCNPSLTVSVDIMQIHYDI